MAYVEKSYIGKGIFRLGPADGSGPIIDVGNSPELTLGIETEEKSLPDYRNAGGGKINKQDRITAVSVTWKVNDYSPENIARAIYGDVTAVTASVISGETHTAHLGGLVLLDRLPDPDQPLTVKDQAGTTTYVEGTDYERTRAGFIPLTTGSIVDASTVQADYTTLVQDVIQMLTQSQKQYIGVFDGLNEAQSGKPSIIVMHKTVFSPTDSLSLIGDDYGELSMTGELLADYTKGTGLSAYAEIRTAF